MDLIDRQAAIEKLRNNLTYMQTFGADRSITLIEELPSAQTEDDTIEMQEADIDETMKRLRDARVTILPSAEPEIIRCKDCKHNPKDEWFGCPMSHLSEAQRPETAWCWKAERRTDDE